MRHAQIIALIVASMLFMEQLDGTILATALPSIARSLHVDPVMTSTALTSYIVGLAIFIPVSGVLADRLGSRTVLMAAITIFVLCSALCGQATSLGMLAVFRMLQGIGGALMVPVGRLVLLRSVAKAELLRTMMWMMMPAMLGPLLGPVVGGFITTTLSWRWIFYINIPVGMLGLFLTWRFIPQIKDPDHARFDFIGMCLAGGGLATISIGSEMISHGARPYWLSAALILFGMLLFAVYFKRMRGQENPVLDFRLMRIPTFRISVLGGAAARIGVGSLPFLLPSLLQIGFGLTAAQSGLVTFAAPVGALMSRLYAQRLIRRLGFRTVMMVSGVATALIFSLIAGIRPGWALWPLTLLLVFSGAMQAIQFSAYNTIAYADVPAARMSAATSFYSTFQQILLSAGICTAALAVTLSRTIFGHAQVTYADFAMGFLVTGAVSLMATPISSLLDPDAGSAMSGRDPAKKDAEPQGDPKTS